MIKIQKAIAMASIWSICVSVDAQEPFVERPQGPIVLRSYKQAHVAPVSLTDSDRVHSLLRAGKLYLTLQDALAIAIENNLDLQIDRYGPLVAEWDLERKKAGGPLKGVTSGNSVVNQVTSGQGANGALQAAGLTTGVGGGGGGVSNGNISQIGPITPNLDPVFQNTSVLSHTTTPEPNIYYYETPSLVDIVHKFQSLVQEGLITGGYVQVSANESYLNENSPFDNLNPSVAPSAQIYIQHNLLQGFGAAVNSRFIRISQKQLGAAEVTFRSQLTVLVQNVVNLYWGLVAAQQDLQAKEDALRVSEKFNDDTRKQLELGVIARVEIYRAEADLSSRKQDLVIAQETVSQQETQLKGLLSRTGLADPLLEAAQIVTLDRIPVPTSDEIPPLKELVSTAMTHRPDVQLDQINDEVGQINAIGTKNNLLPFLQARASTTSRAEAGGVNPDTVVNPLLYPPPQPSQVGGLGNALGQVFRHDYTSRSGTLIFAPTIGNHLAQGDYGIDQLQLRQGDLVERRNRNQMAVDISNQVIALRQARARYTNAVATRELQATLLEKEQQRFALGGSTIDLVIAAERALSAAQYVEIAALSTYSQSRVGLDQTLGLTLESNHISVDQALKGRVEHDSKVTDSVPGAR
jgi:outer membrane protein